MAERRQRNTPLDADGKQRQYRLRKVGSENDYVNYFKSPDVFDANGQRVYHAHGQRPTFNKRGKVFTTYEEAEDTLAYYALRRLRYPYDKSDFPELEIVVSIVQFEVAKPGNLPSEADIKRLDAFSMAIAKAQKKKGNRDRDGDYYAEFSFAQKLLFRGESFRYILVTKGVIDRSVMKATSGKARIGAVGRMNDTTICCFAVNSETDLTFARMALNENLATIWDYQKAKLVFGQPTHKYDH